MVAATIKSVSAISERRNLCGLLALAPAAVNAEAPGRHPAYPHPHSDLRYAAASPGESDRTLPADIGGYRGHG